MKIYVIAAVAIFGSLPALAQDQASCKAYFQVLRADAGMPGLRVGLDSGQKRWWDSEGQKKYPGLCLNGTITSSDKPRYLVIWSHSKTIGQASVPPAQVYGQTSIALQATAPAARIYQPRWDLASVTIINVLYDNSLLLPPVYFETDDRLLGAFTGAGPVTALHPGSRKVLEAAVKYLAQQWVFCKDTLTLSRNCR